MSSGHILLLVMVVFAYSAFATWVKHRNKRPDPHPEAEEMLEKIELLEERIRVLERIVTEHNVDLRRQIDSL